MVQRDAAALTDVAVELAVGLLEELSPHFGTHEKGFLGAPVVVGEDHVGLEVVYKELGVHGRLDS